jgi:hypothetical protein
MVLVGDEVNIDIEERTVTIRWSLLGCGSSFILLGSKGLLGATTCGLPASPLDIFTDKYDTYVFRSRTVLTPSTLQ